MNGKNRPHIVLVVNRGEAVRNFLDSDKLPTLNRSARATLLSTITDKGILNPYKDLVEQTIILENQPENRLVTELRYTLHMAHYRWRWTTAGQYMWSADFHRAESPQRKLKLGLLKGLALPLANRPALENLTKLERDLSVRLTPTGRIIASSE